MRRPRRPRGLRVLWWLWIPLAYLMGSIPCSYLAVRWLTGLDVRRFGSGNPGATNALRVGGLSAGSAALLGDAGKGILATVVPRCAGAPQAVVGASAVAVTAGHVFPAFLGLRGGKGTATGFGALVSLAPGAALGSLGIFAVTVAASRYVSLGSMLAAGGFPVLVLVGRSRRPESGFEVLAAASAVTGLILTRHRGNLRRLREGSERKLSSAAGRVEDGTGSEPNAGPINRKTLDLNEVDAMDRDVEETEVKETGEVPG